jgi:uncharacterized radical SAM superfamily Fe-S cluster-containing enzyme
VQVLNVTQSVCPVCNAPVSAAYVQRGDSVYFETTCPVHGRHALLAAAHAADWEAWMAYPYVCVPPKQPITKGAGAKAECPLHCGVCENHLMTACCVLLDVTERCNQHCPYCFAVADEQPDTDPALDEIERWYDRLIELGEERPFNIQLSGGEPTVREDLPEIIRMGRAKGFDYIQLNTNGRRLGLESGYAERLKAAGVTTIFLQFDGMNDGIYEALRAEPLLEIKKRAIENCAHAHLPVTLVPMVVSDVNTEDIGNMIAFMLENLHVIKGIHFQPVSYFGRYPEHGETHEPSRVTMFSVMHAIEAQSGGKIKYGDLVPISTGHPLCCFCSNFVREPDGSIVSLVTDKQKEEGMSCCPEEPDAAEIVRRDRDFVLNKWVVSDAPQTSCDCACEKPPTDVDTPQTSCDCACEKPPTDVDTPQTAASIGIDAIPSLDEAIAYLRRNTFTISGMAFMDRPNLDAERLKRCRVQVFTPDERLIPFCGYNAIYRK